MAANMTKLMKSAIVEQLTNKGGDLCSDLIYSITVWIMKLEKWRMDFYSIENTRDYAFSLLPII